MANGVDFRALLGANRAPNPFEGLLDQQLQAEKLQMLQKQQQQLAEAEEFMKVDSMLSDPNQAIGYINQSSIFDDEDKQQFSNAVAIGNHEILGQARTMAMQRLGMPEVSEREKFDQKERQINSTKSGRLIGAASPKDFTVESLSAYQETGNIGDLVRHKPHIRKISGIDHEYDPGLMKWVPLVDMNDPGLEDQVKAEANLEAIKQSKLDFTKAQSAFKNNESKYLTKLDSATSKRKVLEATIGKIKEVASEFNTQYGAALSGWPAAKAKTISNLLKTVRANSAFTTLVDLKEGGGTLGAISEAELELLGAAMGHADQAGDIDELFRVLDQVLEQNNSSIARVRRAYNRDKTKYGSSFEEVSKPLSDEDLLKKYNVSPGS